MVRFAYACVLLAGCKFAATAATSGGDGGGDAPLIDTPDSAVDSQMLDAAIDAPPPPQCTAMSAQCLDAVTLSTCSMTNATPVVTTCNWGCISTGTAHCGQLAPEGGAVNSGDLTASNTNLSIGSPVTINTMDGTITGFTGFSHVQRGNVMIFEFQGLTINAAVTIIGPNAAAIVADGPIVVNGVIDARGPCATMPNKGGPGGFGGGAHDTAGMGTGAGGPGTGKNDGGGGAGHGGAGGAAGQGGGGGGAYGASFSVLVGGSGGGGGHNQGPGGGGGGAVQLVSNTSITIGNSGGINAGGCGGGSTAGDGNAGGGGGGAGGTVLIEAPVVTVDGALAVNGGAGGASTRGGDATLDRSMAMNANGGGAGGAAATPDGQNGTSPGGGGGGVGRMHFDTRTGTVTVNGTMSPAFADPGSTSSHAAATVQ